MIMDRVYTFLKDRLYMLLPRVSLLGNVLHLRDQNLYLKSTSQNFPFKKEDGLREEMKENNFGASKKNQRFD